MRSVVMIAAVLVTEKSTTVKSAGNDYEHS
jgi:hypothetical protein